MRAGLTFDQVGDLTQRQIKPLLRAQTKHELSQQVIALGLQSWAVQDPKQHRALQEELKRLTNILSGM